MDFGVVAIFCGRAIHPSTPHEEINALISKSEGAAVALVVTTALLVHIFFATI